MNALQALLLGAFQGVTEFLPISSSGHLVLAQRYLGLPYAELLAFDVLLHGGTLLATLLLFRREIADILLIPFRSETAKDRRFLLFLLVATLPAGIAGFLFEDWFAGFRSVPSIAVAFLLTGFLFLLVERWPPHKQAALTWRGVLLAGCFQILALFPGVSRSGITMAGGMMAGVERAEAVRFSFFLGIPITAGAVGLTLARMLTDAEALALPAVLPATIAFVSAALIGYVTARFLLRFFRRYTLNTFAAYLIAAGSILLVIESL